MTTWTRAKKEETGQYEIYVKFWEPYAKQIAAVFVFVGNFMVFMQRI